MKNKRLPPLPVLTFVFFALMSGCGGSSGRYAAGAGNGGGPQAVTTHFQVTAVATATAGTALNFSVTALDASGNAVTTYSDTVHFKSSDSRATLPADSSLTNGTATFAATLETVGAQTITATDTTATSISGVSNSIQVAPPVVGFVATGSMSITREAHTATPLNDGRVLMAGGMHWADEMCFPECHLVLSALASAELYDPTTGQFARTGNFSAPRVFHTATLLSDGRVLIVGGDDRGATTYATAELFDPVTGQFTLTGSLLTARNAHAATVLADGRVLVTGGSGTATAEVYDPATGKFSATGSMANTRFFHTATLLSDGRVLVAGGVGGGSAAELYDPATGVFSPTGSMTIDRSSQRATLLASGAVLLTGGATSAGTTTTAELFDPVSGTFAPTGSMGSARELHTATLLGDGTVLVTGGVAGGAYFASAELFDPATAAFTPTVSMATGRSEHSATLLKNGVVLVAGGINHDNSFMLNSLATAELYP